MTSLSIPRREIDQIFRNPRSGREFERLLTVASTASEGVSQALADTNKLNEAAFLTLSANAELPNERVLKVGDGLRSALTENSFTLATDARTTGGFTVTFASSGDSLVSVPLTGHLASQEWVAAQGLGGSAPVAVTATFYTVTGTDKFIQYAATAASTVTLGTATAGRVLWIANSTAFAINSASSNVVPLASTSPGTAILPATAGKWAMLVGNGTNWVTMAAA